MFYQTLKDETSEGWEFWLKKMVRQKQWSQANDWQQWWLKVANDVGKNDDQDRGMVVLFVGFLLILLLGLVLFIRKEGLVNGKISWNWL